jgi:hypothetical protein
LVDDSPEAIRVAAARLARFAPEVETGAEF